jgi:cell division septum initiation protein DivIVA
LAGSLWLLPAGSAQSTDPPPPGLEELWEEYPLVPETQPPAQPEPIERPAVTPAPGPTDDETGRGWLALAGGIGAVLVLAAAGGLVARSRLRRGTAGAEQWSPEELISRAHALATEAAECDKYVHVQRHEGISVMTGTHDLDLSGSSDASDRPTSSSYADIGERVAGVLAAAETAATHIREDARASAEEILSIAREEAEALRAEAAAYDADTRAAVDSYASDRRRNVDEEVEKQLAESESQARATRQAAEAMARQIEEDARRRGQALRDESRAVEERLKKAAQGLRRMTTEIDELLGAPAVDGESLTDALRPYSQRPELPVSAAPGDDR